MGLTEEIHILVIFSCENGEVEQLALAAAVGAVQARATIRLRRMVNPAGSPNATTERMDQDYVAPRATDTAWAHGLVLAVAGHYLPQLQALGGLAGKPAVSLAQGSAKGGLQEVEFLSDSEEVQVGDRDLARLLGRRVAETVRAQKGSSQ
jgi:hypothetical protein